MTTEDLSAAKLLIVDDDQDVCQLLCDHFNAAGHTAISATSARDGRARLDTDEFDLIFVDLQLGEESGLELCGWITENRPGIPVVIITGYGSMDAAVDALRAGAYDFVTKPVGLDLLGFVTERALGHKQLRAELKRLQETLPSEPKQLGILGESRPIVDLVRLIDRVAPGDATVLICGESGTGKELVAKAVHQKSARSGGPFVAVNCAALPSELLESELFGHERGAFTGARQTREGLLRQADQGTLFLDEVAEMSADMQVKLLRVLQERQVRPIGGQREVAFDARLICATNRDLETEVEEGRLREDFYYRINVVTLRCPPLRARGNDVLLLAQSFLRRFAERSGKDVKGLSAGAAEKLLEYDWPGNVRQLQNVMERAVALTQFDQITVEDLPEKIRSYQSENLVVAGNNPEELITLSELERRYIDRVLAATAGNKAQAARVLGLDRRTLYRKLERYERYERYERSSAG